MSFEGNLQKISVAVDCVSNQQIRVTVFLHCLASFLCKLAYIFTLPGAFTTFGTTCDYNMLFAGGFVEKPCIKVTFF